jgi:hypothetical protein
MKSIITLLLATISLTSVHAQRGFNFTVAYPVSFPVGNMSDYISQTSFRGITMEFNHFQTPNLNLGIETGWNVFYERVDNEVFTDKTASISGVQFRYTNAVPIIAGAKYYRTTDSNVKPFIGAGLGTLYIDKYTDFGLYRIIDDAWQFCIRPEIGIAYGMGNGSALTLNGKYYAGFEADDLEAQNYFSISLGIIFGTK